MNSEQTIKYRKKMSYYDYDEYEDEYAGTYAHDVEGFSDEDIDTIFDGASMAEPIYIFHWRRIILNKSGFSEYKAHE